MWNKENIKKAKKYSLEIVTKNLKKFCNLFPDANTLDNIYPIVNNNLDEGSWTAGFWTGMLWNSYLLSDNVRFKKFAEYHLSSFRKRLSENILIDHHDIGFLYIPTAVFQYELTKTEKAKETIIWAANILYKRFKKRDGYIQAWGSMDDIQSARIIIDCNLNVPLLFKASKLTGDDKYKNAAVSHLNLAEKYLLRDDGSTFHTFYFDFDTGKPIRGVQHQGKDNDSTWARGQAWGVYGFALAYKQTGDAKFLNAYIKTVEYYLSNMSKDKIPFWDMSFSEKDNEEKDSSATTIFINGILEMNYLWKDDRQKKYESEASKMFDELVNNYLTIKSLDAEGIVSHATYNKPSSSGVDESVLWGDFYFMQIITRLIKGDEWINIWV